MLSMVLQEGAHMVRLRIKDMAKAQGLNQKQLQQKASVSVMQLNRYWNNHASRVDLETLGKIARALGVQPGDLIVFSYDEVS